MLDAVGARDLSRLQNVMTGSAAHLTSYSMGKAGPFPGLERPRPKSDHLPPPSTEVNP